MDLLNYSSEDEINIIELTAFFRKYRWWVIIPSLLIFLIVFLYSALFIPKTYSTSAIVKTTAPPLFTVSQSWETFTVDTETISGELLFNQVPVSNPIYSSLMMDYANDKNTIDSLFERLAENGINYSDFEPDLNTNADGNFRMVMYVKSEDAQISSLILEAWVDIVVEGLNNRTDNTLVTLESEMEIANQEWIQSQKELEEFISQGKQQVLEVELEEDKIELTKIQSDWQQIDLLEKDLSDFIVMTSDLEGDENLDFDMVLAFLSIQQQARNYKINQTESSLLVSEIIKNYTVNQIQEMNNNLISYLGSQKIELEEISANLENQITETSINLEQFQNQFSQLALERNRARDMFVISTAKLELYQAVLEKIATQVYLYDSDVKSPKLTGPYPLRNAALVSALVIVATTSLALLFELLLRIGYKKNIEE